MSTSALTYELTGTQDHELAPGAAQSQSVRETRQSRLVSMPVGVSIDDRRATLNWALSAVIASAVAAYMAAESRGPMDDTTRASWADEELYRDLRGAGPWPSGRASWHRAERPR